MRRRINTAILRHINMQHINDKCLHTLPQHCHAGSYQYYRYGFHYCRALDAWSPLRIAIKRRHVGGMLKRYAGYGALLPHITVLPRRHIVAITPIITPTYC